MFWGASLSNEQRAVIAARIKKRVKELLPNEEYIVLVNEVACADPACPTKSTVISVCDQQGNLRKWSIHAPMVQITTKEIDYIMAS